MYELEMRLSNRLPFAELSSMFPELRIYRWCSSLVGYLEIYGRDHVLSRAEEKIRQLADELHSSLTHRNLHGGRLTVMMGCMCSVRNSTIRMAATIHGVSKSTMQEHINKAGNKLLMSLEPYLNLRLR